MEFTGPGLLALSMDERATLANMATECSAKSGICEADEETLRWIVNRRPGGASVAALRERIVAPDPGATYAGGIHHIDLSQMRPMVATPGDPDHGVPSDPTNGAFIDELGDVPIDIAYGGSCTAGKEEDFDFYAKVLREAVTAGRGVAAGVEFYIQFGSRDVEEYSRKKGYLEIFEQAGARVISAGCGACIGCGPGVEHPERSGHGVGDQPQLPRAQRPGPPLPGLAPDRGRVGGDREDRGLETGNVRCGSESLSLVDRIGPHWRLVFEIKNHSQ